jgi:hypothetical protein
VRGWEKNKNKARDANFQRMDNFNWNEVLWNSKARTTDVRKANIRLKEA